MEKVSPNSAEERKRALIMLTTLRAEQRQVSSFIEQIDRDRLDSIPVAKATYVAYSEWENNEKLPLEERRRYKERRMHLEALLPFIERKGATLFDSLSDEKRGEMLLAETNARTRQPQLKQEIERLEEQNHPALEKEVGEAALSLATNLNIGKVFTLPTEELGKTVEQYFLARALATTYALSPDKSTWRYSALGDMHERMMKASIDWTTLDLFRVKPVNSLSPEEVENIAQQSKQGVYNLKDGDDTFPVERLLPESASSFHGFVPSKITRYREARFMEKMEAAGNRKISGVEKVEDIDEITQKAAAFTEAFGNTYATMAKNLDIFPPSTFARDISIMGSSFLRAAKEFFRPFLDQENK